jgi:KDO2-lipid IV(A) lauroyltransferase
MSEPALTPVQKLRYGAEAVLFFLFMGFFRLLGVDAASAVGGAIGRHVLAHLGWARKARQNLAMAFPEKSEAEREALVTQVCDNVGRTAAEYAHLDKFQMGGNDPRIAAERLDIAETARGKGALLLSGHFANWEIMPIAATEFGLDGAIVYRPPNNPYVDRVITRARAWKGYKEQISKHHGTRRIFTILRGGKAILLLADQKTNEGIPAPFFGRDAMTTPAPAALALKLKVPVYFASNRRAFNHGRGGARFIITMHEPLDFTPSGDYDQDVRDMTAAINARLEAIVRADPGQWLWIHRRWPTDRDIHTGKRS